MITSREYTAERLRRVDNYLDEPFEDNGKYTTISGDTLFSKLEEIGETLQCIRDTGDEGTDPKTYTITETDLTELEGAVHEANRERIFLKGLVVELENAVKVLTEEHRVLSDLCRPKEEEEEPENVPEQKEAIKNLIAEMNEYRKKFIIEKLFTDPEISQGDKQGMMRIIQYWHDPESIEKQTKELQKMLSAQKKEEEEENK